jgi:uncharacterized SAM-binding protein YcdF (DUF218 family)
MLTLRERFICVVDNEPLRRADIIILLEGDGLYRVAHAAKLFSDEWAPQIIVSGGLDAPHGGSVTADTVKRHLCAAGVPNSSIILDEKSLNTRDQAVEIMRRAIERRWSSALLVASHYHQYRAYLTFLKAMQETEYELCLINAAVRDLPWYRDDGWGPRLDLLNEEFVKIERYQLKGHVASFADALEYQRRKEKLRT